MAEHVISLQHEDGEHIATVTLPIYPVVGDVVVDKYEKPWMVSGRRWAHQWR